MALTAGQSTAAQLLMAYLGRSADVATLQNYASDFVNGQPTNAQLQALASSAEHQSLFGGNDLTTLVYKSYEMIGRTPTAADATTWVNWIHQTNMPAANVPWEIMKAALITESNYAAADQVVWARAAVAYKFAEDISANADAVVALSTGGALALSNARAVISAVTDLASGQAVYNGTGTTTIGGAIAAISGGVTPTYTLTANAAEVNEGGIVVLTLQTTNVAAGTTLSYTISGNGITQGDINGGQLTGSVVIDSQGKAVFQVATLADSLTEGQEALTVTIAGKTVSFNINDISVDPIVAFTTSAQDNVLGTARNDVFQAEATDSVQSSATNTLSGGDKANGGDGTDRVVLTTTSTTAGGTQVNGFQFDNVEELEIRAYEQSAGVGGTGTTLGLVNVNGLQKVISTTSTSGITLNNVNNMVALDLTGNGAAGTAVTVNYQADVTSPVAGQTQTIALNNFGEAGAGNQGLIAVDGVETFSITTAVASSRTELAGSALTALNLTLGQDLALVDLDGTGSATVLDTLTSVTAGAADAGALTADLTGAANAMTVATGAGADVLTVEGTNANTVTTNAGADTVNVTVGTATQTITTGEGNDTVVSSNGSDVIDAGAGDDRITIGGDQNGVGTVTVGDSVIAGEGNDYIIAAGNLSKVDTIAGGEGDDTLEVTNIGDVDHGGAGAAGETFANVSSIKTLSFTAAASGTLNAAAYDAVTNTTGTKANAAGIDTYTFQAGINGATTLNNIVNAAVVNVLTGTVAGGENLTVTHDTDTAANGLTINVTSGAVGTTNEVFGTVSVADDETLNLSFTDSNTTATDVTGAQIDTLTIAALTAGDLKDLELSGNGHITVTAAIGSTVIQTVNSTSTGNISLSTANTATAVSVTTLGGADNITTGNGADTINVGDGANVVVSGNGNDTVTSGAGNDNISAGNGNDVITAGNGTNTVDGGAGNDHITTGTGNDSIHAGVGDDVVVAGDGNDTIWAGDGTTGVQLEGVDNLDGGAGNDTFVFNYSAVAGQEGLTSADTVSGGDGTDTVQVMGDVAMVDDIYNNWTSVETLDVSDSGGNDSVTVNAIANRAGLNKIVTGAGNDTINVGEGFTSSLTVQLAAGNDKLDASSAPSSATITVEANAASITAADTLLGGQGANDTIRLKADDNAVGAVVNATGFEKIVVVDGNEGGVDGAGGDTANDADGLAEGGNNNGVLDGGEEAANTASERDITITVTDATVAAGATLTVDATALTDKDAKLTLNASAETDGKYNVLGGEGADVIVTGAGADTISGGAGNNDITAGAGDDVITTGNGNNTVQGGAGVDSITTGSGNDVIYSGAGADTINAGTGNNVFRFDVLTDSNSTDTDTIVGFQSLNAAGATAVVDQIQINDAILTAGLNFAGNAANFGAAQGNITVGGTIDYVFQQDTNTLWVDINNDGTLNAQDLQIKLQGVTSIEANDVASYTVGADALSITNNVVAPASAVVASLVNGGLGASTLTFNGTNDISGLTLLSIENAVFSAGSANTMTFAQYNALAKTSAASSAITLTTAGALGTLVDNVSTYNLVGGSSATVNASELNVTINSTNVGNTAITLDTAGDSTATYALAGANDSLTVATGRSLVGINTGGVTTAETLNMSGTVTMNAAQHVFTTVNAGTGADQITLATAGTVTTAAAVETYSVVEGSTVTVGTTAGHLAQVITETVGVGTVSTIILGNGVYTGDYTGLENNDVIRVGTTTDVSGNTGLDGGVVIDFNDVASVGAGVTLNATQNGIVTFANTTGSQTVTVSAVDTFNAAVGIEKYDITGASNITVLAGTNVVGKDGSNQTVTIAGGTTIAATTTYALGTGTDIILITNAGPNTDIAEINGGQATTAETLDIQSVQAHNVTMTVAQHNGFTTISSNAGDDIITLTNATAAVLGDANIGTYVLQATSGNDFTLGADGQAVTLSATAGADTLRIAGRTVTGTIANWGAADTLVATTGADISAWNASVNQGTLNLTGAITMTEAQSDGFADIVATGGGDQVTIKTEAITSIVTDADVETYVIQNDTGDNGFAVTINGANQTITSTASVEAGDVATFSFGAGALTFNGTITGEGTGNDVLSLANNADIKGATITAVEDLTLANGATVTMKDSQWDGFTGTITAAGTETVRISDAATVLVDTTTSQKEVENFVLQSASDDSITFKLADTLATAYSVNIAASGADTVVLNNVSIDTGTAVVTVTGFDVTNDEVRTLLNNADIATTWTSITAANKAAVGTGLVGDRVIEINTDIGEILAPTSDAALLNLLGSALANGGTVADIANGDYTVIAYQGANAYLYQMSVAGGDGLAGSDETVELVGIFNAVGANAFVATNFS